MSLPNVGVGKCLLLLALPHVSSLTLGRSPTETSTTMVAMNILPHGKKFGAVSVEKYIVSIIHDRKFCIKILCNVEVDFKLTFEHLNLETKLCIPEKLTCIFLIKQKSRKPRFHHKILSNQ